MEEIVLKITQSRQQDQHFVQSPSSGDIKPLIIGLVLVSSLISITSTIAHIYQVTNPLITIALAVTMYMITLRVLRWENIPLKSLGLSAKHFIPGLLVFLSFWIIGDLFALILDFATTGSLRLARFVTLSKGWPPLINIIEQWLFVGPVEELFNRGYVQTKILTLLKSNGKVIRRIVALFLSSLIFALLHIPHRLPEMHTWSALLPLVIWGLVLGYIYDRCGNLVFSGLLHGSLNVGMPIIIGTWLPKITNIYSVNSLSFIASVVLVVEAYRRWELRHQTEMID
ncbi:hypothetical protein SY88_13570 [Clostridiales bacterium PH28_bin88]|nr:hypothetical protein SY88_13570 [Clostridiales bacterium PH28_bin88]